MRCPSCQTELNPSARFCASCGRPTASGAEVTAATLHEPSAAPVIAAAHPPSRHAGDRAAERFAPGQLLAGGRYRIVGLLGAGGMGEVYRADDLRLGQAVALKFLPERWSAEPAALARLLDEVKIARQVSHPNVCRVYDVVEIAGAGDRHDRIAEHQPDAITFISMEFVDGEDLASLIRRIGRLPEVKGIQIARQLCAGLAAAHERGVLHRDLKPANIMIDGRGNARIMDFGLAGVAAELTGTGHRAGTPAYMAPEQLARGEVSARSDVYALGLVLYEVFTGQPAFFGLTVADVAAQRDRGAISLSRIAPEISPAVERTILRCLESDPGERPGSAGLVAASLPGGDPLAAAVAAGETPSPELLAAVGTAGSARPAGAVLGGVLAILMLLVAVWMNRQSILFQVPLAKPPEVLVEAARSVIAGMGGAAEPVDVARGFELREALMEHAAEAEEVEALYTALREARPAGVTFWYRQSPSYFDPPAGIPQVTFDQPPPNRPGMAGVRLDTLGRLIEFRLIPAEEAPKEDGGAVGPDWAPAFAAAGLGMRGFAATEPERIPPVSFDRRWAWVEEGISAAAPRLRDIRVEAASRLGRPVWFCVTGAWEAPEPPAIAAQTRKSAQIGRWMGLGIAVPFVLAPIVFSLYLARRNIRAGRGDARGAARVATVMFATQLLFWALTADHGSVAVEYDRVLMAVASALLEAVLVWIVYMAIEPYVRRRWPGSLVSWSRLVSGRAGDPLVGRDLVLGAGLGAAAIALILSASPLAAWREGVAYPPPPTVVGLVFLGQGLGSIFDSLLSGVGFPMLGLAIMLMLGGAVRRRWLAVAGFGALSVALGLTFSIAVPGLGNAYGASQVAPEHLVAAAALVAGTYVLLWRYGLLAGVAAWFTAFVLSGSAAALDLGAWYAAPALLPVLVIGGLVAWGTLAMLQGRELVRDETLLGSTSRVRSGLSR